MKKDDPLFGLIEFRRDFGFIGAGYWHGKIDFPPVGKSVEIFIRAGRSGINEAQRDFYKELEQRYNPMIPDIGNVLIDLPFDIEDMKWFIERYKEPEWQDYELESIYIPRLKAYEPEWSMSYYFLPSGGIYVVYFEGWKPTHGDFAD